MSGPGFLLVRAGGRLVGIGLTDVVEVLDPGRAFPVPTVEPAVRGVVRIRDRIVPMVHLGALLAGEPCPPATGEVGILVRAGGHRLCLEVDDAESVLREPGLAVPDGATLPWAAGVARAPGGLIPLLDLTAVGARIVEAASA